MVRVDGHDRAGRERLLRYCARPPFAPERLETELAPSPGSARENGTSPARAPPELTFDFDQTPTFDSADPEPEPEFRFDQSRAG